MRTHLQGLRQLLLALRGRVPRIQEIWRIESRQQSRHVEGTCDARFSQPIRTARGLLVLVLQPIELASNLRHQPAVLVFSFLRTAATS